MAVWKVLVIALVIAATDVVFCKRSRSIAYLLKPNNPKVLEVTAKPAYDAALTYRCTHSHPPCQASSPPEADPPRAAHSSKHFCERRRVDNTLRWITARAAGCSLHPWTVLAFERLRGGQSHRVLNSVPLWWYRCRLDCI